MRLPHALALALVLSTGASFADTANLLPSDDTALFESSPEDDYNFGGQRDVPIGTTAPENGLARARGLFRFDIAAEVPAGSTINSATLCLTIERGPSDTATFDLHRMLVPWVEGDKNNPKRPGGRAPDAGEPTWNHRAAPSTTWGTPGGQSNVDYSAAVSASETVTVTATKEKNPTIDWQLNATGIADVQAMLDTPTNNLGWLLKNSVEGSPRAARRFYTKETLDDLPFRQGIPPVLIVDFTPPTPVAPPEVTSFSSDGTNLSLQFVATAGLSYEVQSNTSLLETGWSTVETFNPVADGTLASTIPIVDPKRTFVRVLASDN